MGLAQAKKRAKLSHDPQNTHWARDTSSYGHKLLLSQGWSPGNTLGASAVHAEHFTAASSSHIRAVLRQENLGLGAKIGSGQAAGECVGLDAFQNLLGRLNGKSEEVIVRESEKRREYSRNTFAERKYGMRFVRAGVLRGEREFGLDEAVVEDRRIKLGVVKKEEEDGDVEVKVKIEDVDDGDIDEAKRVKREKKLEKREPRIKTESNTNIEPTTDDKAAKKARKEARRAEKASSSSTPIEDDDTRRALRKAEKAAKKALIKPEEVKIEVSDVPEVVVLQETSETAEPVRIVAPLGRANSVRSRYIQQKRMAVMDPQALKEIFMVKG